MGVALVALASCSNEEVMETNKGHAINFRVAMGNGANSRATEITEANFPSSITVTAYLGTGIYFKNVVFTKDENGKYTHTPEFYWPKKDELTFYSLPGDVEGEGYPSSASFNTTTSGIAISYTPSDQLENQQDLVAASATGSSETVIEKDNGLALIFKHLLSQIRVKAKNTNTNYKFTIAGIKIGNVLKGGSCTFTTSTTSANWTGDDNTEMGSYTIDLAKHVVLSTTPVEGTNDVETFDLMGLTEEDNAGAMLIPQDLSVAGRAWNCTKDDLNRGSYLAVKLNITMTGTGLQIYPDPEPDATEPTFAYAYTPLNTNWEAGYKYIYTLDFSRGAGKDEDGDDILDGTIILWTDIDPWGDETEGNVSL